MSDEGIFTRTRQADLTPAFGAHLWYKETSTWRKYLPTMILVVLNVLTLSAAILAWNRFKDTLAVNFVLDQNIRVTREEAELARREHEARITELNFQLARMEEFQQMNPADVVALGKTIARILDTASGSAQRAFLEAAVPQAIRLQIVEDIPASAVLAMAIYESGYGRSKLAKDHHNYFGMKAFSSWSGARAEDMPTRDSGVKTTADFRSYATLYDGFLGFSRFLKSNDRYDSAFQQATSSGFVQKLLQNGYCPDPDYLSTIQTLMERHRLTEIDGPLASYKSMRTAQGTPFTGKTDNYAERTASIPTQAPVSR